MNIIPQKHLADADVSKIASTQSGDLFLVERGGVAFGITSDDLNLVQPSYASRAAFVTAVTGGLSAANGTTIFADGLAYRASTGATTLSDLPGWLPAGDVHVDHWAGNAVPGTTDMTAAMIAAASYMLGTGNVLHMKAATYLFNKATSGFFNVNGYRLQGAGMGSTIINSSTTDASAAVQIRGTSAAIRDVTIKGYPRVQVQTGTDLKLERVEIECSDNASSAWESLIAISDAAVITGLFVEDCYLHHGLFGMFTANNFGNGGNQIKHAIVRNNRFSNMRKTGISINSDFATSGANQPWVDVLVEGNSFRDYAGETSDNSAAVAFDNGENIRIVNNYIEDHGGDGSGTGAAGDYAIHLENLGRRVVVTGNTIKAAKRGIVTYGLSRDVLISGNIIEGLQGNSDGDDPSTFAAPAYGFDEENGIYVVTDVDGETDRITINDNTVTNFNVGMRVGGNQRAFKCQGNTIGLCSVGMQVHTNTMIGAVDGNVIDQCRYVYASVGANSAFCVGANKALYCDELFHAASLTGGTLRIDGLEWAMKGLAGTGGADTYYAMFAAPDMIDCSDGKVSAQMFRLTNASLSTANSLSLTYDGTTVVTSLDFAAPAGSAANRAKPSASNQFRVNGGNLECQIALGGSSPTNDGTIEATYSFRGVMAYQV